MVLLNGETYCNLVKGEIIIRSLLSKLFMLNFFSIRLTKKINFVYLIPVYVKEFQKLKIPIIIIDKILLIKY